MMAHHDDRIERRKIERASQGAGLDEQRPLRARETSAREISGPVIGDGDEPTELGRHRDERHGIEPRAEHE